MILKKITLATLITMTMFSCSTSRVEEIEKASPPPTTLASNQEQKTSPEQTNDLDDKMNLWFIAFNYYQDKGYDMETADKMAREAVEKQTKTISLETLAVNPETDLN